MAKPLRRRASTPGSRSTASGSSAARARRRRRTLLRPAASLRAAHPSIAGGGVFLHFDRSGAAAAAATSRAHRIVPAPSSVDSRAVTRRGAAKGRVAPRRGCVWSPRAVAAARGQEARAAGGKRCGPPARAVVGRGSNFSDFGPPPRVKNESLTLAFPRFEKTPAALFRSPALSVGVDSSFRVDAGARLWLSPLVVSFDTSVFSRMPAITLRALVADVARAIKPPGEDRLQNRPLPPPGRPSRGEYRETPPKDKLDLT